jgi:hypothetical protein
MWQWIDSGIDLGESDSREVAFLVAVCVDVYVYVYDVGGIV